MGVVGDVRNMNMEESPAPQYYGPFFRGGFDANSAFIVVRSMLPKDAMVQLIRGAVRSLDASLAIGNVRTMSDMETEVTARRRFQTTLLTIFSAAAMLLAIVGVYGLVAYSVRRRTGEIGIRMALGARRSGVVWLVLAEGLVLLTAGLGIGLVAAVAMTRLLSGFLYGVVPIDAATYVTVPVLLLVGTLIACLVPSVRAASIDPMDALRHE